MENIRSFQQTKGNQVLYASWKEQKKKLWHLHLLSFLLPILLFLPALAISGIFPFGNLSTMAVDLKHEYVGFYEAYREALTSPTGFFYNFYKSLGGEMAGTFSYYLMSPLNLLFFLVPRNLLPYAIELVQILKLAFSGLFFSIYLVQVEKANDYKIPLFSTLYALMSYSVAYLLNHMWLDPILLFPLILVGLEKVFQEKNPILYVLSLSLAIISNFYIAYMLCIFLVLYALYRLIRESKSKEYTRGQWMIHQGQAFVRFGLFSILAAGIAAFLLFPSLYTLMASKASYSENVKAGWAFSYPIQDFLTKLLPATFNYDQVPSGLPNIFAGSLTLIFAFSYFFNGRIKIRERIIAFFILGFLILSTSIEKLTVFWHGMQYPIWYEHRFSWLISFFMILIAFRSMMRTRNLKIPILLFLLISYAGLIYFNYIHLEDYDHVLIYHLIAGSLFFIFLLIFYLWKRRKPEMTKIALIFLSFIEISANACVHTMVYSYEDIGEFQAFEKEMSQALEGIRPKKDHFYRIEKTFSHDNNDGMRFSHPTLSHFNSALERKTVDFMDSLGFTVSNNSISAFNSTKFTDAFFGIGYYLTEKEEAKESILKDVIKSKSLKRDLEDMKKVKETDLIAVYKNDNILPLGILAESKIMEFENTTFVEDQKLPINPLDYQEKILCVLDGKEEEINYFRYYSMEKEKLENLTTNGKHYQRIKEGPAYVEYEFDSILNSSNYISLSKFLNNKNSTIYLDGNKIANKRDGSNNYSQVYNIASSKDKMAKHTLRIDLKEEKDSFRASNVSLFALDEQAFQEALDFQKDRFQIVEWKHGYVKAKVHADQKTPFLVFTIPFDQGWQVKVDQVKAPIYEVQKSLLGVQIKEGEHEIELSYQPPLLMVGIYTSLLSIAILLVYELGAFVKWIIRRRKK